MKRHPLRYGLLAALGLACLPGPGRGQDFLGKPMAQWQADLAPNKAPAQRRSAAFALGKIGKDATAALGDLAARLEDPDAGVREASAFAIGEICHSAKVVNNQALKALCARLKTDKDALVRRSAAYGLGGMGKGDDADVQAALNAGLKDDDPAVRQNVAWALGRMGDEAVPNLRQSLKDPDPLVRRDAAKSVDLLGSDAAAAALPELVQCCQAKDLELQKAAVAAVVRLSSPATKAAGQAQLLPLLNSPDQEVRRNAALAIGHMGGPEAAPAVPVLVETLTKADPSLQRQAALAFKNIGPDAKAALPELRKALHAADKELKHNVAVALIGFKETGEPAVPDLVELVKDRKEAPEVRKQAAVALSRIGFNPPLVKAMPILLGVVGDPGEVGIVRERALWPVRVYLVKSEDRAPVYKTLEKILSEPGGKDNKMLRYDSAYIMGMFLEDKAPEKALDVLSEFLKDTEIKIYGGISGGGQGTTEGKQGAKADSKEKGVGDGRIMAVDALEQIGVERVAKRKDIVQQLQVLADNPNTLPNLRAGLEKYMPKLKKQLGM